MEAASIPVGIGIVRDTLPTHEFGPPIVGAVSLSGKGGLASRVAGRLPMNGPSTIWAGRHCLSSHIGPSAYTPSARSLQTPPVCPTTKAELRAKVRAEVETEVRAESDALALARERALLRRLATRKFGADTGDRLAALLEEATDPDRLAEVGDWIILCEDGGALLTRTGTSLPGSPR